MKIELDFDCLNFRDCLGRENLEPALVRPGSGRMLGLVSHEFLVEELHKAIARKIGVARSNLPDIARRFIQSRRPAEIREFEDLWVQAGSASQSVEHLACAVESALQWPDVSGAHADFVKALNSKVIRDDSGPLGNAVRQTRYWRGETADHIFEGERSQGVGFPMAVVQTPPERDDWTSRLAPAIWVSLEARPVQGESQIRSGGTNDGARRTDGESVGGLISQWDQLITDIPGMLPQDRTSLKQSGPKFPREAQCLVDSLGVSTLDSAGLGLALDYHAWRQDRAIPAGVGFTGRWENGRLKRVSDVSAKLGAAREAGILLMFACVASDEPVASVRGVRLERLEEDLSLNEVIVRVNTVCARLGVTEHRLENATRWMTGHLGEATRERWLPEVATSRSLFPVGFVGRSSVLDTFEKWNSEPVGGNAAGRLNHLVVGSPRSGKTSVLARWMRGLAESDGRTPIWFGFLRGSIPGRRYGFFLSSLAKQIEARHCVLLRPRQSESEDERPQGGYKAALSRAEVVVDGLDEVESEDFRKLQEIIGDTQSRVDIVIDGLDEAEPESQGKILQTLAMLMGKGLTLVSSQSLEVLKAPEFRWEALQLDDVNSEEQRSDADALVRAFADNFRTSAEGRLNIIGEELCDPNRRRQLIGQTGANLWILKDLLSAIHGDRAELPRPGDRLGASGDVHEYAEIVLEEVKGRFSGSGGLVSQSDVEILLRHLSLNVDRPWPLHELLQFSFEDWSGDLGSEIRWRDALKSHARRLLEHREEDGKYDIRYRDMWFAHYVESQTPPHQRERIVEKLIQNLRPDSIALPAIRDFAVQNAAMLVAASDAPDLADKLVAETNWASKRFVQLVTEGRFKQSHGDRHLESLVAELWRLERLCKGTSVKDALRDLRGAVSEWGGVVSASSCSPDSWWKALAAVQAHQVWREQKVEKSDGSPDLLVPVGGYRASGRELPWLTGTACELPNGNIVLAGREDDTWLLIVFDPKTEEIKARKWLHDIPCPRQMVAIGEDSIALLASHGEKEHAVLAWIDLWGWTLFHKDIDGEAIGLINLRVAGEGKGMLLAAVRRGERFAFLGFSDQPTPTVRCEIETRVSSWGAHPTSVRGERRIAALPDGSFVVWLDGGDGAGVQILGLDAGGETIPDRTPPQLQALEKIRGCAVLPDGRLLIAVPPEQGSRCSRLISVEGRGVDRTVTVSLVQSPERPRYGLPEPRFSEARPLGCIKGFGIIFGTSRPDDLGYWSIPKLDSEPSPQPMPEKKFPDLELVGSYSLSSGGLLLIDPHGLVIAREDGLRTFGIPDPHALIWKRSVEGVLGDGSVVVRECVNWREPEFGSVGTLRVERHDRKRRKKLGRRLFPTRPGHLAVCTRHGVKARPGGFSGDTKVVATAEILSPWLNANGAFAWWMIDDIECDGNGNWVFLFRREGFTDVLLRDCKNHWEHLARFEGFDGNHLMTIEQLHGRAILLRSSYFEEGWERERSFLLINGPDDGRLIDEFKPTPPLLPLTSDWMLIRGWHNSEEERRVFLIRVDTADRPIPVDDLDLGDRCFVNRVYSAIDGSIHVDIVSLDDYGMLVHRRRFDSETPALVERDDGPSRVRFATPSGREWVAAWTPVAEGLIAIGYAGRRLEIIEIPREPGDHSKKVRAEGFLTSPVDSMITSKCGDERRIAVASGDRLEWFKVP